MTSATRRLQRVWRRACSGGMLSHQVVDAYLEHGPTTLKVQAMGCVCLVLMGVCVEAN